MTVNILRRLLTERADAVQVRTFGCVSTDPILDSLKSFPGYRNYGELSSAEVEALMRRADVFLDLSVYQAMGLSCLEAMASGATVIGPVNGGLSEIVIHEESGLLVDTRDEEQIMRACLRLVDDFDLRRRLGTAGVERTSIYFPDRSASALAQTIFSDETASEVCQ